MVYTLKNWSEVTSKNYFKGVEVVKVNKTSVRPKEGATPQFYHINKNGVKGAWYAIDDVEIVDKAMIAENKRFINDLNKKIKNGDIDVDKAKEVLTALGIEL